VFYQVADGVATLPSLGSGTAFNWMNDNED